jgi:formate dehydrogenase subunit delta
MNIDLLIKMANEIGSFWEGEVGADTAANDVATHIKRYWEPRMRAQMLTYFEQRQGAGLSDVAKGAVALLASQAKPAPALAPASGEAVETGAPPKP